MAVGPFLPSSRLNEVPPATGDTYDQSSDLPLTSASTGSHSIDLTAHHLHLETEQRLMGTHGPFSFGGTKGLWISGSPLVGYPL